MSSYTRFPNRDHTVDGKTTKRHENRLEQAERYFRIASIPARTSHEKTALAVKQIVQEETERRQTLTEALRTARLRRTER